MRGLLSIEVASGSGGYAVMILVASRVGFVLRDAIKTKAEANKIASGYRRKFREMPTDFHRYIALQIRRVLER